MNVKRFLELIDQEYAFKCMFKVDVLRNLYSPIRGDSTPSCYVKLVGDNYILIDNKTGAGYDIIDVALMKLGITGYNTLAALSYLDSLTNAQLLSIRTNETSSISRDELLTNKRSKQLSPRKNEYRFTEMDCQDYHKKYFKSFGVNIEKHQGIVFISKIYKNDILYSTGGKYNPIIGYVDGGVISQVYRPFADSFNKFLTIRDTIKRLDWLDYTEDTLIISKSTKDCLLLNELGYQSIAPSSESNKLLLEELLPELKTEFKHIYIFFDEDDTGITRSLYFKETYNIQAISTGEKSYKDITDYTKKFGKQKAKELICKKILKILEMTR